MLVAGAHTYAESQPHSTQTHPHTDTHSTMGSVIANTPPSPFYSHRQRMHARHHRRGRTAIMGGEHGFHRPPAAAARAYHMCLRADDKIGRRGIDRSAARRGDKRVWCARPAPQSVSHAPHPPAPSSLLAITETPMGSGSGSGSGSRVGVLREREDTEATKRRAGVAPERQNTKITETTGLRQEEPPNTRETNNQQIKGKPVLTQSIHRAGATWKWQSASAAWPLKSSGMHCP